MAGAGCGRPGVCDGVDVVGTVPPSHSHSSSHSWGGGVTPEGLLSDNLGEFGAESKCTWSRARVGRGAVRVRAEDPRVTDCSPLLPRIEPLRLCRRLPGYWRPPRKS